MAVRQNAILSKDILKSPVIQANSSTSNSTEAQGKCVFVSTENTYKNVRSSSAPNSPD